MKKKVLIMLLIVVVIGCGVGGYFIFRKKLKFDYEKGAVANATVMAAQYTPDIDKFVEANKTPTPISASTKTGVTNLTAQELSNVKNVSSNNLTLEEFTELVNEYGTVENYAGAGKYLGYDIYEIKNEIAFVTEKVPAFNQWFRMPTMREEKGYISIPYYENWAYYLEMDKNNHLSITRVCWCTRSSYLDFDNKKVIEDHDDGTSFVQYEIMKTNYYTNTNGDEVVECFIYSVGVDNVGGGNTCNRNTDDYYPFEYQYLKNVKDKSLIKYHITAAERYRDDEVEYLGFNDGGMDIRGLTPYGSRREFTIVNYDGYVNIDLTKIDQKFATLENPTADGAVNFDIGSDNIKNLIKTIGLSETEYSSSGTAYNLMDKIAKQIIDNFEIKNNWAQIYKDSTEAIEVDTIYGDFYGKDILISYVHDYVAYRGKLEFDATADIYDMSKFDINKQYSLSMALRNRESGNLYIIATSYRYLQKVKYDGATGESEDDYYYTLSPTNLDLDSSIIKVTEEGEYDVTCVLTEKANGEDVVVFDTHSVSYLRQYSKFYIPDYQKDGLTYSYNVAGTGGKLTITVTAE